MRDELDTKKKFHYCLKDFFKIYENKNDGYFLHRLDFIKNWQEDFSELFDYTDSIDKILKGDGYTQIEKYNSVVGFKTKITKEESDDVLLHLWMYYLQLNDFYIYKNYIYKKIERSLISYSMVCEVDDLYKNISEVLHFFINEFPFHFKNYNLYEKCVKNYLKSISQLETLVALTPNKIRPVFDLLEFTDGIYSIRLNKFIPAKYLLSKDSEFDKKFSTLKYYNFTYKHLNKTPKIWDLNIRQTLGNNEENITKLKKYIANVFHKNDKLWKKQKVLFIVGESNTQKTTLIAEPLINFFGIENVGIITKGSGFNFQDIENKIVLIIDEYDHQKKLEGDLLKWFEGSNITIEIKYDKPKIIQNIPTIIISNSELNIKKPEIKEAFENRCYKLYFKKKIKVEEVTNEIKKQIKKEEASIIINCNNEYFTDKKKNKKWNRLDYSKFLELINYEWEQEISL